MEDYTPPTPPDPPPTFDTIPDVVDDYVEFDIPQCDDCGGSPAPDVLEPVPEPDFPTISWDIPETIIGMEQWGAGQTRGLIRDLTCNLLDMSQYEANYLQQLTNEILILLNEIIRLLIYLVVLVEHLVEQVNYMVEYVRVMTAQLDLLYQIDESLDYMVVLVETLVQTSGALPPVLLLLVLERAVMVMGFIAAIMHETLALLALALVSVDLPDILNDSHMLYSFFRGVQDAFHIHPLTAWMYVLFYGMAGISWFLWASRYFSKAEAGG
jgi:hypothetical protein